MSLRAQLRAVVEQVDGAIGCTIMGFDGIAVESHQLPLADELELSGAWVEFANVLSQFKQASSALKTGPVNELSINAERLTALIRAVSPDYFVALAVRPDANFGKARYLLRVAVPKLLAEL